ncbi:hypothetical protein [Achromobacter mucicolens]|uniref:hypothetical protein n=1 Tax=Achromobacter mucicolens TaxID=1389922 RepID=UPI002FE0A5E9
MQASNAPTKSAVPFANSGAKNTIPVASQIGITPGLASFTDGFPPLTMTPLAAGGVPPYGQDFNGILNFLSSAVRWAQAGGLYPYDAAFSTAIGGYPRGAVLAAATGSGRWVNTVDNNTTNPDTGGANWISLGAGIASTAQAQALTDDTVLLTPKKLADAFKGANQSLGATSGWQIFPGGLIRQYGTISGFAGYTITLPVAFPGGIIGRPSATCVGDQTTSAVAAWAETSDLVGNQFKVFTYTVGATGGTINSARAITWEVWGKL